jgi:RNA polymerase sigma factor (sigma-70 family)
MGSSDHRSDAELLVAARDDRDAFAVFYRRHVEWVLAFSARRLGSAELAADVTSEVFAATLLGCGRYDAARGPAHSWLFGIVVHQLASAHRRGAAERRAQRRLGMDRVQIDDEDIDWISSLAAIEDGRLALVALAELPADQRELITARVFDERPYEELARERGLTPAAIRQRVSRGFATLRSRLQEGASVL